MKIALVDDNAVNRSNFIQKISFFANLEADLVATSGYEFLEKIKNIAPQQFPLVVFMDMQMPGLNGIETIKIAKAVYPAVHFIVLTVFEDDDMIFEAIRAGASGYLLKHESHQCIYESIQTVLELGATPVSPAIARKALKLLSEKNNNELKRLSTENSSSEGIPVNASP